MWPEAARRDYPKAAADYSGHTVRHHLEAAKVFPVFISIMDECLCSVLCLGSASVFTDQSPVQGI